MKNKNLLFIAGGIALLYFLSQSQSPAVAATAAINSQVTALQIGAAAANASVPIATNSFATSLTPPPNSALPLLTNVGESIA